ncbi:MAG: site-2 protease family protein [Candidatus Dormibacteraeota bacterium]|nr:site-2 protease family protein [Candidatus Dormibacteraeota bacterium]
MTDWTPPGVTPPPPPPPPLVLTGDGYTWRPEGSPSPGPLPATAVAQGSRPGQRRGGVLGAILAVLYGFFKWGLVLLKFGKLGGTAISFGLSLLIYIGIFGWQFGVGALLLIAIHESGHMLFARFEGLKVSAPIFLGPFGALVTTSGFRSPRQEAVVAIGGPVVGTAAALLCYVFAQSMPATHLHYLLLALAYFGCLVNLFNLIPMSPLDGGRVASAVSRWANVVGLGVVAALIVGYYASGSPVNPFLFIILLFGAFSTYSRFKKGAASHVDPSISPRTRLLIGLAYVAMLVISAAGMSAAHSALLSGGIGQPIV